MTGDAYGHYVFDAGRDLTVFHLNGVNVIDNQPVLGCTGGAALELAGADIEGARDRPDGLVGRAGRPLPRFSRLAFAAGGAFCYTLGRKEASVLSWKRKRRLNFPPPGRMTFRA